MAPFLKPRGFWDYAVFALGMTALLAFLFWMEASARIGWADAALASSAAVLFVFLTVLFRRGEKAKWITRPTWPVYLLASIGIGVVLFGALYADAYLLHHAEITSKRLGNDAVFGLVMSAGIVWSFLR